MMRGIAYGSYCIFPFSKSLKGLYEKVNDEFEPLVVVNKIQRKILLYSQRARDSLQETLTVARNTYLSQKFCVVWLKSKQGKPKNET